MTAIKDDQSSKNPRSSSSDIRGKNDASFTFWGRNDVSFDTESFFGRKEAVFVLDEISEASDVWGAASQHCTLDESVMLTRDDADGFSSLFKATVVSRVGDVSNASVFDGMNSLRISWEKSETLLLFSGLVLLNTKLFWWTEDVYTSSMLTTSPAE